MVEEIYDIRYQNGSFPLIYVGSAFHCLRSFFFFLFLEDGWQKEKPENLQEKVLQFQRVSSCFKDLLSWVFTPVLGEWSSRRDATVT
jgi:hypothetical protein